MKTKTHEVPVPPERGPSVFAIMRAAVEGGVTTECPAPQARQQTAQPSRPPVKVSAASCVHSTPRKRDEDPRLKDWRMRATPKSDWD